MRTTVLLAFLISGLSTLIYEIVWFRWLTDLFGVTWHTITTVVTVFMVGLALGALLAGRITDRLRSPVAAYGVLEVFIGICGVLFPFALAGITAAYHGVHDSLQVGFAGHVAVRFVLATLLLMPPTLAMGATLPCLARFYVRRRDRIGLDLGWLYGINTLGAAIGSGITGFVLLTWLGLGRANGVAVALNVAAAVLALSLARRAARAPTERTAPTPGDSDAEPRGIGRSGALFLVAFFLSGFTATGYELLWTRIAGMLHPNLHGLVFSLVLTMFLLGMGLGSLVYATRLLQRLSPAGVYGGLQLLAGILALGSPFFLVACRHHLADRWYGYDETIRQSLGLFMSGPELLFVCGVVGVPGLLFGMTFPVGNRLYLRRFRWLGSHVGAVYFTATMGGVAGSFLTGFLLIPALGTKTSLVLLGCLNLVIALSLGVAVLRVRAGRTGNPRWRMVVSGALGLAGIAGVFVVTDSGLPAHALVNMPLEHRVLAWYDGRSTHDGVVEAYDPTLGFWRRFLFTNGEWIENFAFGIWAPIALHPAPDEVLILGFDTGANSAMALHDPRVGRVSAVDISDGQIHTFAHFEDENGRLLDDPRFRFVSNDARNHLATTRERYDLIYNGVAIYAAYFHMSTREFFELARDRLDDDGIFVLKLHPDMSSEESFRRVLATFTQVFPGALLWQSELPEVFLLMGTQQPGWKADRAHLIRIWDGIPPVDPEFEAMSVDRFLGHLLHDHESLQRLARDAEVLVDDRPMRVPDVLVYVDTEFDNLGYTTRGERTPGHGPAIRRALADGVQPPQQLVIDLDEETARRIDAERPRVWREER